RNHAAAAPVPQRVGSARPVSLARSGSTRDEAPVRPQAPSGAAGTRDACTGPSLHNAPQGLAEFAGLVRRHLDDKPPTAFKWDTHHDAPSLLRHLEGTVAGPGLHGRHSVLPPCI